MAVSVEIKHSKNISMEDILGLSNLGYGVLNDAYSLIKGRVGKHTILYDMNCIGRGIEVSLDENSIYLNLPLPSTVSEIELFYNLIEKICKRVKVKEFYCDEELNTVGYTYHFIEKYKEISLNSIIDIMSNVMTGENERIVIFCALNPIFIGRREVDRLDGTIETYEKLLNELQQLDVVYATPVLYQRKKDNTFFGCYFLKEGVDMVVPLIPYQPFNLSDNVSSWYVMIPDDTNISYDAFISNIGEVKYYDNGHVIVNLTEEEIKNLTLNYSIDMVSNERKKKVYFGKTLDNGYNHVKKIRGLELDLDELAGYNHLAIYLRFCIEHDLVSDELLEKFPDLLTIVKENKKDLRGVIRDEEIFNGTLKLGYFNDLGRRFSLAYYVFNSSEDRYYPRCVDIYAEKFFGTAKYNSEEFKDEAYLFVPYDEDYYQGLSRYIDDAFKRFIGSQK